MTWKPTLTVTVEYEGATFVFESPDEALARYTALVQRWVMNAARGVDLEQLDEEEQRELAESVETRLQASMPDELAGIFADMFVEGCRSWEGVEGDDGPLECDALTRRQIPFADKLALGHAYVQRLNEIDEGKGAPPRPRTTCTPGATEEADQSGPMSERVQDSEPPTGTER
jgi:hypothetical protein